MPWTLISLLTILGLGVPILQRIYNTFLNTSSGSWLNWTVSNATPAMAPGTYTVNTTAYSQVEFATFQFIPFLAALMALMFLLWMIGGGLQRHNDERRMRGEK